MVTNLNWTNRGGARGRAGVFRRAGAKAGLRRCQALHCGEAGWPDQACRATALHCATTERTCPMTPSKSSHCGPAWPGPPSAGLAVPRATVEDG